MLLTEPTENPVQISIDKYLSQENVYMLCVNLAALAHAQLVCTNQSNWYVPNSIFYTNIVHCNDNGGGGGGCGGIEAAPNDACN